MAIQRSREQFCGPNGSGPGACDNPGEACCLAPGLGNNALVGRIGSGTPFLIGSSKTLTATANGTLYLGMNETANCGGCADNQGSWPVTVRRHREKKCGPDGSSPGACDSTAESCCLAPGLGNDALVGKIGSGRPFRIGSTASILADSGGILYLGINDTANCGGCLDNDGSWTVTVQVESSCAADVTPPDVSLECGGVSCRYDGGEVEISWEATDNCTAAGAIVFRYRLDGGLWSDPFKGTELTLTGQQPGYHTFQLQASDEGGKTSEASCDFFVPCPMIPEGIELDVACANVRCEDSGGTVTVSWQLVIPGTQPISPLPTEYRYRLSRVLWSSWSTETTGRIPNLDNGSYRVEVQARSRITRAEIAEGLCGFEVRCPSYPPPLPTPTPEPLPPPSTSMHYPSFLDFLGALKEKGESIIEDALESGDQLVEVVLESEIGEELGSAIGHAYHLLSYGYKVTHLYEWVGSTGAGSKILAKIGAPSSLGLSSFSIPPSTVFIYAPVALLTTLCVQLGMGPTCAGEMYYYRVEGSEGVRSF